VSRNLIRLIQASARAGTAGQTFRQHVNDPPLPDGRKMTDYLISDMTTGGQPVDPQIPLQGTEQLPLVNHFVRGAHAGLIQRNNTAAYSFTVTDKVGGGNDPPTFEYAYFNTINGGQQHEIGLIMRAPFAGTIQVTGMTVRDPVTVPGDQSEWPVIFYVDVSTDGMGSTYTAKLMMEYKPDSAQFNPWLNNGAGWPYMQHLRNHTTADIEVIWYKTTWNGSAWVRGPQITNSVAPWNTSSGNVSGLFFDIYNNVVTENLYGTGGNAAFARAWLEWRPKLVPAGGTWNVPGMIVSSNDPRVIL
jgi:hypothetical protein